MLGFAAQHFLEAFARPTHRYLRWSRSTIKEST